MNEQEAAPEGHKDSQEKAVKEMFGGLRRLMDDMDVVANKLKAAQGRHADVLAGPDKFPMGTTRSTDTALLEAILDITSAMADAQVIAMEMGQRQLKISLDQMEKMIDLEQ